MAQGIGWTRSWIARRRKVLADVGRRAIRASGDITESTGEIVTVPEGLNLGVLGMLMDLVASSSPGALDAVARWRQVARLAGQGLVRGLVERAGMSAEGASAWQHRRS